MVLIFLTLKTIIILFFTIGIIWITKWIFSGKLQARKLNVLNLYTNRIIFFFIFFTYLICLFVLYKSVNFFDLLISPLFILFLFTISMGIAPTVSFFMDQAGKNEFDKVIRLPKEKNFPDIKSMPDISFIICSYHEPFDVSKMTFNSAAFVDYKGLKEIVVVDNSIETESEDFMLWKNYVETFTQNNPDINVKSKFIHNKEKDRQKAGNIDIAIKNVNSEFVFFLDIDSTLPQKSKIIQKLINNFETDKSLGFVVLHCSQTNVHFSSFNTLLNYFWAYMRTVGFFRSLGGFSLFPGHNGIWRKEILDKLGTWCGYDTRGSLILTEDIFKTIDCYAAGYYGIYILEFAGELSPNSLKAWESMWNRWTYGTIQTIHAGFREKINKNRNLFVPGERFSFLLHLFSYLSGCLGVLLSLLSTSLVAFFIIFGLGGVIFPQYLAFTVFWLMIIQPFLDICVITYFDRKLVFNRKLPNFTEFLKYISILNLTNWIIFKAFYKFYISHGLLKTGKMKWVVTPKGINKNGRQTNNSLLQYLLKEKENYIFLMMFLTALISFFINDTSNSFVLFYIILYWLSLLIVKVLYFNIDRTDNNTIEESTIEHYIVNEYYPKIQNESIKELENIKLPGPFDVAKILRQQEDLMEVETGE